MATLSHYMNYIIKYEKTPRYKWLGWETTIDRTATIEADAMVNLFEVGFSVGVTGCSPQK